MRIFVDENIPKITVRSLLEMGHDVRDLRGTTLEGMEDEGIWDLIQQEGCILITTDKGFMQYRNNQHNGILVVRLKQPNRLKIHKRTMKAIIQFAEEEWKGLIVVMRDNIQSVLRSSK
jgi:predicted nuclease of predicted toxin-antitoxin system